MFEMWARISQNKVLFLLPENRVLKSGHREADESTVL
jgi:hypothetical protein